MLFTKVFPNEQYVEHVVQVGKMKGFPTFMKENLQSEHMSVEHIVSDERTEKDNED